MSILCVFDPSTPQLPNKVLTHAEDITAALAEHGVTLVQSEPGLRVRPGTLHDELMDACQAHLDHLMITHACRAYAVINRDGVEAQGPDLRDEHVLDTDEVIAVVSGRVQVGLRLGAGVYSVMCEKGDQLCVPAGTQRWLELGETPFCLALRLFAAEAGSQLAFTGDASARAFLGIDEL
ncbi:oxidase [Pseudomonas putida]|uniref:oxidase n=1 Tax=Pseudomonas putida TaxID=303 RepID=UPI0018E68AD0|nr:oxidase [Pseudomonas putida]MBI6925097.1 oxidase [Pseudomonas putida]